MLLFPSTLTHLQKTKLVNIFLHVAMTVWWVQATTWKIQAHFKHNNDLPSLYILLLPSFPSYEFNLKYAAYPHSTIILLLQFMEVLIPNASIVHTAKMVTSVWCSETTVSYNAGTRQTFFTMALDWGETLFYSLCIFNFKRTVYLFSELIAKSVTKSFE
jgi:hypothetical protein